MSRKVKKVNNFRKADGIILVFLALILTFIYWFFGLNYILQAYQTIEALPDDSKAKAIDMLRNKNGPESERKGILVRMIQNDSGLRGIWIWNYGGLRYYKVDDNVKFHTFSICEDQKWKQPTAKVSKSVNMNYEDWNKKSHKGDYAEILLSKSDIAEEIIDYDWWVFASPLPYSYFELACKNR